MATSTGGVFNNAAQVRMARNAIHEKRNIFLQTAVNHAEKCVPRYTSNLMHLLNPAVNGSDTGAKANISDCV